MYTYILLIYQLMFSDVFPKDISVISVIIINFKKFIILKILLRSYNYKIIPPNTTTLASLTVN